MKNSSNKKPAARFMTKQQTKTSLDIDFNVRSFLVNVANTQKNLSLLFNFTFICINDDHSLNNS